MREVSDLIGAQRAAAASMIGPTQDIRFEEGTVDYQLAAALE